MDIIVKSIINGKGCKKLRVESMIIMILKFLILNQINSDHFCLCCKMLLTCFDDTHGI